MPRKISACSLLALTSALPLVASVQAQTPPTAGQLLRDVQPQQRPAAPNDNAALPDTTAPRPAMTAPSGLKLRLAGVRISGAQTQSPERLQALVADALGQELDFAGLQALAERIGAYYRAQGYAVARAYLPAQDIRDGQVEIAVQEGRLAKVNLSVAEGLPADEVQARVRRLRAGEPLMAEALEGDLLTLSDVPGLRVQSVLRPGQSVGTSELDIQVAPGDKLRGSASLDNWGNRYSGEYRLSGQVNVASPFMFGDALDAAAVYGGRGFRYARLAWQAPLGASGWQAGVAQSAMQYALGNGFASLDAHGKAFDSTLYAIKTLQRSRSARLQLNLALDHKRYEDAANGSTGTKRADVGSLNLAGQWQQGAGNTWAGATIDAGRLRLDPANVDADAQGHRTAGRYAKLSLQGGHEYALAGGFGITLRGIAQLSTKNLDSSEKLGLGGVQGVRAYPQGEASCDDALIVNAEVHQDFGVWRAKLFADYANGREWHRPLGADTGNQKRLHGVGAGVDARLPGGLLLQAVLALRTAGEPTSDTDRSPRAWVQLNKTF